MRDTAKNKKKKTTAEKYHTISVSVRHEPNESPVIRVNAASNFTWFEELGSVWKSWSQMHQHACATASVVNSQE